MTIPTGYMKDSQGRLVPSDQVKPEHLAEDGVVRDLVGAAAQMNKDLTAFRAHAMDEAMALRDLVFEKYGASKGGAKGNMTLRSFDGALEVQVAVSETLGFGPELQAAKALVDECIERWAEGSDGKIRVLVSDAFQTNKEGRIDTGRVLGLRRHKFEDPSWERAMDAIGDAVRVQNSKTYIRFYRRDPETGVRHAIPLDLAAV